MVTVYVYARGDMFMGLMDVEQALQLVAKWSNKEYDETPILQLAENLDDKATTFSYVRYDAITAISYTLSA